MPTYVALIRGINVGGNRVIKMADLRGMFEAAGASDVATYIQSGNVVFKHPSRSAPKLAAELEAKLGLSIVVRTATEMAAVLENNPFPKADPKSLHVFFMRKNNAVDIDPKPFLPETWKIVDRDLYVFLPNGVGNSKLAAKLMRAVPDSTARNWRTCETLTAMCRDV